jgi:hypothetical protein
MQDPGSLRGERGRSNFDAGHVFTMNYSWGLPVRGPSPWHGCCAAGNWGKPAGPHRPAAHADAFQRQPALGGALRPDRIAKGTLPNPSPERRLDLAAFPAVPNNSFRFGSSGRNILDGPGSMMVNVPLLKKRAHPRAPLRAASLGGL